MSLFAELKRRNVIRMAGLYLVGAWLIVQVASTVFPMFGAPEWLPRSIVVLLALGFVPALVFSWVYELTPEGLKRDAEVPVEQSIAAQTGRRMNRLIVLGLLGVVALVAADRYWPRAAQTGGASVASAPSTRTRAIAVLPFVNLSGDPTQEFFSDGITEEILNVLAGIEAFTVTSRTSSFHFKGKDKPLPEIARELHVDYVLEGSVRKAGQQVRITAQLIKVDGDAHLWSESWTRDLADIFAVQEGIARNVANELEARLSPRDEARLTRTGTRNVEAYQQYLRGRQFWSQRSVASLQSAVEAFEAALAADPDYADAWAGLAQTYAVIPEYAAFSSGERRAGDAMAKAHEAADHALSLDPASSRARRHGPMYVSCTSSTGRAQRRTIRLRWRATRAMREPDSGTASCWPISDAGRRPLPSTRPRSRSIRWRPSSTSRVGCSRCSRAIRLRRCPISTSRPGSLPGSASRCI